MTELDRVSKSDNFNFSGGGGGGGVHRFCKSARSARWQREKRWTVCTVMVLLHIYSKSLGVRVQIHVCPVNKTKVLMLIKL